MSWPNLGAGTPVAYGGLYRSKTNKKKRIHRIDPRQTRSQGRLEFSSTRLARKVQVTLCSFSGSLQPEPLLYPSGESLSFADPLKGCRPENILRFLARGNWCLFTGQLLDDEGAMIAVSSAGIWLARSMPKHETISHPHTHAHTHTHTHTHGRYTPVLSKSAR